LFFAGLLVLGTGFYIVLLAIGIVPGREVEAPHWILGLCGMAFVVGGGLVSVGELIKYDDDFNLRDIEVARAFRHVMVVFLMLIFVVIGNWVAFGPGKRPVQAVIGLPFFDVSTQTSEWIGRFGFGVGAVMLDSVIVVAIISFVRRLRHRRIERE
jgi:hypothetical protein